MADVDPTGRPLIPGLWPRVGGAVNWIVRLIASARFWLAAMMVVVGYFIFNIVRLDQEARPLTSDDVARAWNEDISRLGIIPIYPPQEDFHVGDVWAVIADDEASPLLGRAVRIGRLDLREEIVGGEKGRPVFSDTADLAAGTTVRRQSRTEIEEPDNAKKRISTAITAFPFITINRATNSTGAAGMSWLGLSGARDERFTVQIQIKHVETYGAPAIEAYGRLDDWCASPETKAYCDNDTVARNLLAAAVSPDVLKEEAGKYAMRVQLRLVTRVFLTREIVSRRLTVDSRGAALQVSSDPGKPTGPLPADPGKVADPQKEGQNAVARATTGNAAAGDQGRLSMLRSDETDVGINGVFNRPVVFGFRAITIKLEQGAPPNRVQQTESAGKVKP